MTMIKAEAPLTRETAALYKGRPLIVELHAGFLVIRPKGKRAERYSMDYLSIFHAGAKVAARERAVDKAAAKRAK